MPVTATVAAKTVTEQVAVFCPSTVVTVIVAFPGALAFITPFEVTVATAALVDVHVTPFVEAFEG